MVEGGWATAVGSFGQACHRSLDQGSLGDPCPVAVLQFVSGWREDLPGSFLDGI